MNKALFQRVEGFLLLSIVMVLGATFYVEYVKDLQPCPLCLTQRLFLFLTAITCLIGTFFAPIKRVKGLLIVQLIFILSGLFFALRQTWLQSYPLHESMVCMPGLEMMVRYLPWHKVLQALLWGASDCSEVTLRWFGLSLAAWSAVYFSILFFISAYLYRDARRASILS